MSSVYINAQLVSACKWLSLMNNCCSVCSFQLFWSVYRCLVYQTFHLPPDKEIHRSEIGRTWWPFTGPLLPIQRLRKTLFRDSLTSRAKCAGAPSCWNHNRCLTRSGTFSNISGNMSRIKICNFLTFSTTSVKLSCVKPFKDLWRRSLYTEFFYTLYIYIYFFFLRYGRLGFPDLWSGQKP